MIDSAPGSCVLFLLSKVISFFYEDYKFLIDLKFEATSSSGEKDKDIREGIAPARIIRKIAEVLVGL